ncbi:MAG: hypothetical protein IKQ35_00620 [Bacilli bacterium]|nr:hypothetical protein [Bacilli bacterium]
MNKDEILLESLLLSLYKKDYEDNIPEEYKDLEGKERIKVLSKSLEDKVPISTTLGLDSKDK